jgi:hypothetical protein
MNHASCSVEDRATLASDLSATGILYQGMQSQGERIPRKPTNHLLSAWKFLEALPLGRIWKR